MEDCLLVCDTEPRSLLFPRIVGCESNFYKGVDVRRPDLRQLDLTRTERMRSLGVAIFQLTFVVPASQCERDGHTRLTQFIRATAVQHGAGNDHTSHAQSSSCLGSGTARPAVLDRATFQNADHCLEHIFERAFCMRVTARHVRRQCDHRT